MFYYRIEKNNERKELIKTNYFSKIIIFNLLKIKQIKTRAFTKTLTLFLKTEIYKNVLNKKTKFIKSPSKLIKPLIFINLIKKLIILAYINGTYNYFIKNYVSKKSY